ncbi:MAG TPA: rod shape-determining protein MreD [Eubacteriaceae bacterium]|nr:rod shape-determining protein MreD [Eubacteriaceae bacterium]
MDCVVKSTSYKFMTIQAYQPNLVLITLMVLAIFNKDYTSWTYAIFIGLITDIVFGRALGVYAVVYFAVVLAVRGLSVYLLKDNYVTPVLLLPVGILLHEGLLFAFHYLLRLQPDLTELAGSFHPLNWAIQLLTIIVVFYFFKNAHEEKMI